MKELRSIGRIRKMHNFERYLMAIPAVDWMDREDLDDYDSIFQETLDKMKIVDSVLEILIGGPKDEKLKNSIKEIMRKDKYTSVKESMVFQKSFLTAYHVQKEKNFVDALIAIASGDKYEEEFEGINEDVEILLELEWEVNPRVATVKIDEVETELKLQDSLIMLRSYLEASEHEFYKQVTLARLDEILDQYIFSIKLSKPLFEEFSSERFKKEPKGYIELDVTEYKNEYARFHHILDHIYFSHAKDYLVERRLIKKILNENKLTKDYASLFINLKDLILRRNP